MKISQALGVIEQFKKSEEWGFQRTFLTPLKDLPQFVSAIFSTNNSVEKGCVIIDDYVFELKTLNVFLSRHSIKSDIITNSTTISVDIKEDLEDLLCAVLADWIDFLFLPEPQKFAIYSDHDEYTTFYASSKSALDKIVGALSSQGFKIVEDYVR